MKKIINFQPCIKSIDEESRTVDFIITKEIVDRDGDIILVSGGDLINYMENPVVLADHDHWSVQKVIGTTTKIEKIGDEIHATCKFSTENPLGDLVFRMLKEGTLRSVSMGFSAFEWSTEVRGGKNVRVCTRWELLEYSIVSIPANSAAVAKSLESGIFDERDLAYMKQISELKSKIETFSDNQEVLKSYRSAFKNFREQIQMEASADEKSTLEQVVKMLANYFVSKSAPAKVPSENPTHKCCAKENPLPVEVAKVVLG